MDINTIINAGNKLQREHVAAHMAFISICTAIAMCADDVENPPKELKQAATWLDKYLGRRKRQIETINRTVAGVVVAKVDMQQEKEK